MNPTTTNSPRPASRTAAPAAIVATYLPVFCTCGEPEPHVIAHRLTYDGVGVNLWSDGAITGVLGLKLKDVPIRRPKTQEDADRLRKVGWLALGEVCIRKVDELPALLKAADKAVQIDNMPGTLRRLMAEEQARPAPIKLHWQTLHADRDGRVTQRGPSCRAYAGPAWRCGTTAAGRARETGGMVSPTAAVGRGTSVPAMSPMSRPGPASSG